VRSFGKCQVYLKTNEWQSVIKHCNEAAGFGEQHNTKEAIVRAHCGVGKAHVQLEEFEDAVRAYQRAKDTKGDDHEANEGHGNASKLLKMSKRKDYYKILGVDKSASEQQIKKAYRKMALLHHPDKQTDPEKKASSDKKFKEVADAYEVLMDPEKKARFDNGEDLNEPPQQVFHATKFMRLLFA
jgi:tetratricopeptide (TPR) repeat protein